MYEQYDHSWQGQEPPQPPPRPNNHSLSTAALICAIMGLVLSCTFYGGVILGGLGITFGLLSRGSGKNMLPSARVGILIGIVAVCISAVLLTVGFFVLLNQYGSIENFMRIYENTISTYL